MKAIDKALQNPLQLGIAAVLVIGVVYYIGKQTLVAAANTSAGVVSGNNAVTQNQTDAAGNKVTAYQGAGILGTLGAGFNSASGGLFASLGETIGGWAADVSDSLSNTSSNTSASTTSAATSQKSAVQDNWWSSWSTGVQSVFTP